MISLLLKDSAVTLHVWTTKWDSDTGIWEANFILAKSSLAIVSTWEDSCVHPHRFLPAFPAAHHLLIHLVRFNLQLLIHLVRFILQLLIYLICSILLICLVYLFLQLLYPPSWMRSASKPTLVDNINNIWWRGLGTWELNYHGQMSNMSPKKGYINGDSLYPKRYIWG